MYLCFSFDTLLQMQTLRSRLALVLLLCFARVVLPEAWVLDLHAHQHTTEEPTASGTLRGKTVLSAKHQHCDVDHFYDVPFQAAAQPELPIAFFTYAPARAAAGKSVWHGRAVLAANLRGPPSQS